MYFLYFQCLKFSSITEESLGLSMGVTFFSPPWQDGQARGWVEKTQIQTSLHFLNYPRSLTCLLFVLHRSWQVRIGMRWCTMGSAPRVGSAQACGQLSISLCSPYLETVSFLRCSSLCSLPAQSGIWGGEGGTEGKGRWWLHSDGEGGGGCWWRWWWCGGDGEEGGDGGRTGVGQWWGEDMALYTKKKPDIAPYMKIPDLKEFVH